MKKGLDPDNPIYKAFRAKIKSFQAQHERDALRIISKVAEGGYKKTETRITMGPKGREVMRKVSEIAPTWQAAAWFLERRYKEEYGKEPFDPLSKKTPVEVAAEIKQAADSMFDSVPGEPEQEQQQELSSE